MSNYYSNPSLLVSRNLTKLIRLKSIQAEQQRENKKVTFIKRDTCFFYKHGIF